MSFKSINFPIIISIFLLLSISILVIYSSAPGLALQQAVFAFFGLIAYFFISGIDYRAIKNLIVPSYFLIIALLVLVFILGYETRGSIRWIPLGFVNIQPSELAKPIMILSLARFWSENYPSWKKIFISLVTIAPVLLLVFKQPDLGTTLTIGALWLGILFVANLEFKKILILLLVVFLTIPVGWFTLQDYQKQRVQTFFNPNSDPLGVGYNIIQSTIAVGSGQFLGRGLGQGTQSRLQFLPEFRTDFIFSAIAEELGFLGSILILSIYFFMISYCLMAAKNSNDFFGFLISIGVAIMLLFQTVVNIGMNVGILPITGITLPLISYGGSSLLATLISLGFVSSVVNRRKRFDFEAQSG